MTFGINGISAGIGIIGGIASGVLFFAQANGGMLGLPLFLLSSLPLMLASLGWGNLIGLISGLSGIVVVFAALQMGIGADDLLPVIYAVLIAIPALFYAALLGLSRAPFTEGPRARIWFPLGLVLMAMVAGSALAISITGGLLGYNAQSLMAVLAEALKSFLKETGDATVPSDEMIATAARFYVKAMPPMIGLIWLSVMVVNLWLAALITRISGRLMRPWDDIAFATRLPRLMLALLPLAIVLGLEDSNFGLVCAVLAGALAMAAALNGLAVTHFRLRKRPSGRLLLGILYLSTVLISLPLIILMLIGLADIIWDLRKTKATPPSAPQGL